jgi:hypothetical protein
MVEQTEGGLDRLPLLQAPVRCYGATRHAAIMIINCHDTMVEQRRIGLLGRPYIKTNYEYER